MQLSSEKKRKIIENNRRITELMRENENFLREEGYKPPLNNYALERTEKIGFPAGYIRTVETFNEKYHLREICPDRTVRQNIAYALEASDLMNYVMNRVNIWGSVETIFFKLAIVNLASIMEAILLEAANNICCNARACGKTKKCYYHFSGDERNNVRRAVQKLALVGVLDYNEEQLSRVQEIIELRNRIHIRLTKGNEMNWDFISSCIY